MKSNLTFAFIIILFLSSCSSSLINKEDCKKDMKTLGLEHGKKGMNKLTDEVRSVCITRDETVNLELYEDGFNMGWSSYCTPFNGFSMGRKGDNYRSFCPPEKEKLFHEKFLVGKTVHEKNDQVVEIEEKIRNLNANTEKETSAMAQKDELKNLQDYLHSLKREIQMLEQQGMSLIHIN